MRIPVEVCEIQYRIHTFPFDEYGEDAPEPPEWTALQQRRQDCIDRYVKAGMDEGDALMLFTMAEDEFTERDETEEFDEALLEELVHDELLRLKDRRVKVVHEKMKAMTVTMNDVTVMGGENRVRSRRGVGGLRGKYRIRRKSRSDGRVTTRTKVE